MPKYTRGVSVYIDAVLDKSELPRVLAKLDNIDESALPTELKALMAASTTVVNKAKRKAPHKTGTLRRSIHMEPESESAVVIGTDVTYARYQEEGTSRMKGKPYLRPALAESKDIVTKKVQIAMKQMLQSQAG